jgi:hypothetical protein
MNWLMWGLSLVIAGELTCAMVGQDARKVPAVDVSTPNRVLSLKAESACSVDFRNARVFGENADYTAQLRNGKYEHKFNSGYESVSLDGVFCIKPSSAEEGQYAVVITNWLDCGGSCSSIGVVQLLEIRRSHPVITQQFAFDSHAVGTGATFDEKSRTLRITGRSDDGSPNCCAKSFDAVTYQWQGDRFVQRDFMQVPAPGPKG